MTCFCPALTPRRLGSVIPPTLHFHRPVTPSPTAPPVSSGWKQVIAQTTFMRTASLILAFPPGGHTVVGASISDKEVGGQRSNQDVEEPRLTRFLSPPPGSHTLHHREKQWAGELGVTSGSSQVKEVEGIGMSQSFQSLTIKHT